MDARDAIRIKMASKDWVAVKDALKEVKAEDGLRPKDAWEAVAWEMPEKMNDRDVRGLLEAMVQAGYGFDPEASPRALRAANARVEAFPAAFWEGMTAKQREIWLMTEVAKEAGEAIARGEPAGNVARVNWLGAMIVGERAKGADGAVNGAVAGGVVRWDDGWNRETTRVFVGSGRTFVYYRDRAYGSSQMGVLVAFDASGRPEAYGVAAWSGYWYPSGFPDLWAVSSVRLEIPGEGVREIDVLCSESLAGMEDGGHIEPMKATKRRVVVDPKLTHGWAEESDANLAKDSFAGRIIRLNPEFAGVVVTQTGNTRRMILPVYWQDPATGRVWLAARSWEQGGKR